jgi:hypothetical protein
VTFLPILGALADYSHRRKQLLMLFAPSGDLHDADVLRWPLALRAGCSSRPPTWRLGPIVFSNSFC